MNNTQTYIDELGNEVEYSLIDRSTTPGKECISINVISVNGLLPDGQQVSRYKGEIKREREVLA